MMKIFYLILILGGFQAFEKDNDWVSISLKVLVVIVFTLLADPYKGIKLDPDKETLHYGIGILKYFKISRTYKKSEIKKFGINQLKDFYYGIDLELQNGEKVTMKKIATLDKAKVELAEIENKIIKYWS